jgi:hypothetical protein
VPPHPAWLNNFTNYKKEKKTKNTVLGWVWWCVLIIPDTWEVEEGESPSKGNPDKTTRPDLRN